MMKYFKLNVISIFFITFCLNLAAYAATQEDTLNIIDLAGKQRMLTQKMTKEILFIIQDIKIDDNRKSLCKTAAQFNKTLNYLLSENSYVENEQTQIKSPSLQNKLNEVLKSWHKFRGYVDVALWLGEKEEENDQPIQLSNKENFLKDIATQNLDLLKSMEKVVFWYQDHNQSTDKKSNDKESYQQAVTINKAGRQRMLTQKMTKELLLMVYGNKELREKNKKELEHTKKYFNKTLNKLVSGDPEQNILPPPKNDKNKPTILNQLKSIKIEWRRYKNILDKYIKKNKRLSDSDFKKVVDLNDNILKNMDAVVQGYKNAFK